MKFKCFISAFFLFIVFAGFAQEVEHNYLVGPQSTSCDSLDTAGLNISQSIKLIRGSKFRFDQHFKLTRKQGLQGGEFYSCDNEAGFLIVKYNQDEYLFLGVKKSIWNQFISSNDPEGY